MYQVTTHFYRFSDFKFETEKRVLWRNHEMVPLPPRASEVLLLLLKNRGNLVERREVLEQVWKDTIVEDRP